MPRYIFTEKDLAPLHKVLAHPIATKLATRVVPVTLPSPPSVKVVEVKTKLSFPVLTREKPNGVPLHQVLNLVKEKVKGVTSLEIRDNRLFVGLDRTAGAGAAGEVSKLLTGEAAAKTLGKHVVDAAVATKTTAALAGDPQLLDILLDDATPDAKWLAAFRKYTVARLKAEAGNGG